MSQGAKTDKIVTNLVVWAIVAAVLIPVIIIAIVQDRDGDGASLDGGGLFGRNGSARLVERLNAAASAQGICYGWEIDPDLPPSLSFSLDTGTTVSPGPSFDGFTTPAPAPSRGLSPELERRLEELEQQAGSTVEPGVDVGSNLGAGVDPRRDPRRCPRWVVFTADYYYSTLEEEWMTVTQGIETNLPISLGPSDLRAAGITDADLLGDRAYARLADAIGALPMIVAEKGVAEPAPAIAAAQEPPVGDKISPPGIGRYIGMGVGGVLVALGLIWIIVAAVRSRRSA